MLIDLHQLAKEVIIMFALGRRGTLINEIDLAVSAANKLGVNLKVYGNGSET